MGYYLSPQPKAFDRFRASQLMRYNVLGPIEPVAGSSQGTPAGSSPGDPSLGGGGPPSSRRVPAEPRT
eukprot:1180636-Prorocentrum_minimum.AAC.2